MLVINGTSNDNKIKCIAVANFVLMEEGIYINWLAVKSGLFNKKEWSNGDDKHFDKRGLGSLLLNIIWQIGICLYPSLIKKMRIMLQVNNGEAAVDYYIHRGCTFWEKVLLMQIKKVNTCTG